MTRHALSLALACTLGGLGCAPAEATLGQRSEPVVYGTDDRQDVYAHPSATLRSLARESIVALMRPARLDPQVDGSFTLNPTLTLQEARNLCADQRFLDQPTSAFCSGTLVAPDIVVTAGHCVETASGCLNTRLVFDYLYTAEGTLAPLEADDVYACAEILAREDGVLDYAYLRLDCPVEGHSPATLSPGLGTTCRNVVDDESVSVLGFGSGLPLKIDSGGSVTNPSVRDSYFFIASLDTFGGNSGSGVFNAAGELVGVLSGGLADYATRASEGCDVVNTLSESFGSEQVGHLLPTLQEYCAEASAPDASLCALAAAACPPAPPDAGVQPDQGAGDATVPADQGVADAASGDLGVRSGRRGCSVGLTAPRRWPAPALAWFAAVCLVRLRRRRHVRAR